MGCEVCKLEKCGGASSSVSSGAQRLEFLSRVKLFKRMPTDQRPFLAEVCVDAEFDAGQVVFRQGEEGDCFFVIRQGDASVSISGKQVARLTSGDYFGEGALLYNEPRSATIVAESLLTTLKITRERFQSLGLQKKLRFANRKAVTEKEETPAAKFTRESCTPAQKTFQERQLLEDAIKSNQKLQNLVKMDDKAMMLLVNAAVKKVVSKGTKVITAGDLDAEFFYVVQDGSFEVKLPGGEEKSAEMASSSGVIVEQGGSFGELALLYLAPRAATITAREDSVVWTIARSAFKSILRDASLEAVYKYVAYLDRVSVLDNLSAKQKQEIAQGLVETTFVKGETIMEQGEVGNTFYIMIEGEVSIQKDGTEQTKLQATSEQAQSFGERALLNDEPRAATVKVISDIVKVLTLDRISFNLIKEPLKDKSGAKNKAPLRKGKEMQRKDLNTIGLLGCGGFGVVELVEHHPTKKFYALKSISKGYVVQMGMEKSVMTEKEIQLMCESDFIIRLHECYNESQVVMLLLELALGGDLYGTYTKQELTGSEEHARFHLAGVVLALDHLHKKKIIYRDLKPENVLLTEQGHVKLTDLGLAKVVTGRTYTTCGTPDYFAPEVIASKGYQHSVDWWTLGVLLFELIVGYAPFTAQVPMQIFENVTKGIGKVAFPETATNSMKDLTKALCTKEPSFRLPMRKGGVKALQNHAWMKGFGWEEMKSLRLKPPYVPTVASKTDLSNFVATAEDKPPMVKYKEDNSGWDRDFATCE